MFSNTFRASLALAATLLLTAEGRAQVIDDFSQGAFSLQSTTFDSGVQNGLSAPHCIASARDTRLFVNGAPTGADLVLGSIDDQITTVFGNGGGRLELRYLPPLTDLTVGGVYNGLRVRLPVAVAAGTLEVILGDASGVQFESKQQITGPGKYDFLFSNFTGVDPTQVDYIQVSLGIPDFGDYHVSDIRCWEIPGDGATANVVTGQIEAGVGEYPTAPLQIALGRDGNLQDLAMMEISILSVTNAEAHGIIGRAEDSGPGNDFGHEARVQLFDPAPMPTQKSSHFRTIQMRLEFRPAEFLPQLVAVHEMPFFGMESERGVTLGMKVYYTDRAGNVVSRGMHTLQVEGEWSNGLEVHNPMLALPTPEDPTAFELTFDVNAIGAAKSDADLPMVRMKLTGSVFDYADATSTDAWTPRESLALWAQPSVMSQQTTFRLARGLDRSATLQVFDVAGRRVRSLALPAGGSAIRWDGQDERGRDVASGVYLARLVTGRGEARAKLVKVR